MQCCVQFNGHRKRTCAFMVTSIFSKLLHFRSPWNSPWPWNSRPRTKPNPRPRTNIPDMICHLVSVHRCHCHSAECQRQHNVTQLTVLPRMVQDNIYQWTQGSYWSVAMSPTLPSSFSAQHQHEKTLLITWQLWRVIYATHCREWINCTATDRQTDRRTWNTRSFHLGMRLPSGQPCADWQNGTPQSIHLHSHNNCVT